MNIKLGLREVILVISLLVFTCFYSCDKTKQLEGTTWEGNCQFDDPYDKYVHYNGRITLCFAGNQTDVTAIFEASDDSYKDDGTWKVNYKGSANYTFENRNITIKINWKGHSTEWEDYIDKGKWMGKANKTEMTLNDVFNQTIVFKKVI